MSAHNSSHADDLQLRYVYEVSDIDRVESCLKTIIKPHQYRKYKEIYEIDIDHIKSVIRSCSDLVISSDDLKRGQIGGHKSRKNTFVAFERDK